MIYRKITEGHVEQEFDDKGNCVKQLFYASGEDHYEIDDGSFITMASAEDCPDTYYPFDMIQPDIEG